MLFLAKVFTIIASWTFVLSYNQSDKLFFLQTSSGGSNETLLVVTWVKLEDEIDAGCEIFKDKDLISKVLESSPDSSILNPSDDDMQNLLQDCTEISLRRRKRETDEEDEEDEAISPEMNESAARRRVRKKRKRTRTGQNSTSTTEFPTDTSTNPYSDEMSVTEKKQRRRRPTGRPNTSENSRREENMDVSNVPTSNSPLTTRRSPPTEAPTTTTTETPGYSGMPIIFPGTKWCGAGDIAQKYADLGTYEDTDACCRTHDHCNDTLAPGETRHNLTNNSPYTKLSCKCDLDFYDCLVRVNSITSRTIGNMYFNLLKRDCYRLEYPLTNTCARYLTFLKITCTEYRRNTTAPKVYQFIPPTTFPMG